MLMKVKFLADEDDCRDICNRLGREYDKETEDVFAPGLYFVAPFGDESVEFNSCVSSELYFQEFTETGKKLDNGFLEADWEPVVKEKPVRRRTVQDILDEWDEWDD